MKQSKNFSKAQRSVKHTSSLCLTMEHDKGTRGINVTQEQLIELSSETG